MDFKTFEANGRCSCCFFEVLTLMWCNGCDVGALRCVVVRCGVVWSWCDVMWCEANGRCSWRSVEVLILMWCNGCDVICVVQLRCVAVRCGVMWCVVMMWIVVNSQVTFFVSYRLCWEYPNTRWVGHWRQKVTNASPKGLKSPMIKVPLRPNFDLFLYLFSIQGSSVGLVLSCNVNKSKENCPKVKILPIEKSNFPG